MTATDFNQMVIRHDQYLHPFAVSLTQNHDDAKDLFQETMLRALLNRDKYQMGTNLKAWLYTIMRNIFINNYRRGRRFVHTEFATTDGAMQHPTLTAPNAGWSHLRMGEIRKAIDALPPVFRLSFELYYTGYKYQEIASLLQEPLGTIKSRIHFARKQLTARIGR